uniref:Uncharacterized protein n=1 Tax=Panagrolaimus sp. ES5 TaxID=591445 RepID=A0AC34FK32_9BILA
MKNTTINFLYIFGVLLIVQYSTVSAQYPDFDTCVYQFGPAYFQHIRCENTYGYEMICIPPEKKCDGVNDCDDWTDERYCFGKKI